jgi:hypothetical protein
VVELEPDEGVGCKAGHERFASNAVEEVFYLRHSTYRSASTREHHLLTRRRTNGESKLHVLLARKHLEARYVNPT